MRLILNILFDLLSPGLDFESKWRESLFSIASEPLQEWFNCFVFVDNSWIGFDTRSCDLTRGSEFERALWRLRRPERKAISWRRRCSSSVRIVSVIQQNRNKNSVCFLFQSFWPQQNDTMSQVPLNSLHFTLFFFNLLLTSCKSGISSRECVFKSVLFCSI